LVRVDEHLVGPDLVLATEHTGHTVAIAVRGELDAYSVSGLEDRVPRLLEITGLTDHFPIA
jgi:anti-anti-sigma regulatory factor